MEINVLWRRTIGIIDWLYESSSPSRRIEISVTACTDRFESVEVSTLNNHFRHCIGYLIDFNSHWSLETIEAKQVLRRWSLQMIPYDKSELSCILGALSIDWRTLDTELVSKLVVHTSLISCIGRDWELHSSAYPPFLRSEKGIQSWNGQPGRFNGLQTRFRQDHAFEPLYHRGMTESKQFPIPLFHNIDCYSFEAIIGLEIIGFSSVFESRLDIFCSLLLQCSAPFDQRRFDNASTKDLVTRPRPATHTRSHSLYQ